MIRKYSALLAFALIVCIHHSNAQSFAKLDSFMNILEANDKFMGSLALSHKGKPIYFKAIGYDDTDGRKKTSSATNYRIGSITKSFTAALIFKAIEEKKIRLDDPISKYFRNIKNSEKITVGNLLNHRSGIHSFTDNPDYLQWNMNPKTQDELLKLIEAGGLKFEPGSKAEYSNSNYVLLTMILEKIYKMPYSKLVEARIVKPLGLKNTYVGGKINATKNEAFSYKWKGKWEKENETDMSVPLGAGAIVSNPQDLNKFMEALLSGKLVSINNVNQMKAITDGYGMGMFLFPFNDKSGYGHTGGIDGFASVAAYFPEDSLGIALTSNGSNYDNNDILIAALSSFFGEPFTMPAISNITLTSADLDKYLGVYSSEGFPMKITITKEGNTLIGQATGQSSFPLEPTELDHFKFDPARLSLEFMPVEKQMILKQGGRSFTFTKE